MVFEKLDPITFAPKLFFLPNIHVHLSILYLLLNFWIYLFFSTCTTIKPMYYINVILSKFDIKSYMKQSFSSPDINISVKIRTPK